MLSQRLQAILLAVLILGACSPPAARTASFRLRPDSVAPGELLGPYSGRVVDASSGEPVAGALVYATWSQTRGYGFSEPGLTHEVVKATDSDGRYRIARLSDDKRPGTMRLVDFHLVVYKRGYVAYRSDRRFYDFGPRRDFAQLRNDVRLDRWSDDYSHMRHLRYIGGGSAVSALSSWESADAGVELTRYKSGQAGKMATDIGLRRPRAVVAAQLLSTDEIKDITGFDGDFETGPLGDEPDTLVYSSQHFKALGRPQSYDVAVRMWKLKPDAAEKRYRDLMELLPSTTDSGEIADSSFEASEGDILAYGYLDKTRGVAVMLTCGQGQCGDRRDIVALARLSFQNLLRKSPMLRKKDKQ